MGAPGPISDIELRRRRTACALLTLIALIVVVLFVLFCVYNNKIFGSTPSYDVSITNANLTRFNLTSIPAASLFYNLSLTMSIQNTDPYDEAHYVDMEIDCYYDGKQFDSVRVPDFTIEPGSNILLNISTSGNSTVDTDQGDGSDVVGNSSNNVSGVFDMEIWLSGRQIIEYNSYRDYDTDLSYQCKLSLPLHTPNANGTYPKFDTVYCS